MQWIPCSMIEFNGFYAAWPKASRLNAVESMQRRCMRRIPCILVQWIPIVCSGVHAVRPMHPDCMQWILCSMAQSIPIECSGFHAASLNADDSFHFGAMDPDFMQWSPCSVMNAWIPCSMVKCIPIERSAFHAAWLNGSRLNAVDSMQHG